MQGDRGKSYKMNDSEKGKQLDKIYFHKLEYYILPKCNLYLLHNCNQSVSDFEIKLNETEVLGSSKVFNNLSWCNVNV